MIQIEETPVLPILLFSVNYNQGSKLEFYYFPDSDSTCVSENIFGRKSKKPFYNNALDLTKFYEETSYNNDGGKAVSDVKRRIKKIISKNNDLDWKSIGKKLITSYT